MLERITWAEAWRDRKFKLQFFASLFFLLLIGQWIPHFFNFIQIRPGVTLHDFILEQIVPVDLSLLTFLLIYSALTTALIAFSYYPWLLLRGIQSYCLLIVIRVATIGMVPLENPPGMIVLNDPLVAIIGYGEQIITKDLFFSGHTSTLFLFFLIARGRKLKTIFLLLTLAVATCILIQHVHYTIDVLAAPLFSWGAYSICFRKMKRSVP